MIRLSNLLPLTVHDECVVIPEIRQLDTCIHWVDISSGGLLVTSTDFGYPV